MASFVTSLNHKHIEYITLIKPTYNIDNELEKLWKVKTALSVSANKEVLVYNGQGLGDTKWKGCAWKLLLFEILIKKNIFFLYFFFFAMIWIIDLKFYLLNSIRYQD